MKAKSPKSQHNKAKSKKNPKARLVQHHQAYVPQPLVPRGAAAGARPQRCRFRRGVSRGRACVLVGARRRDCSFRRAQMQQAGRPACEAQLQTAKQQAEHRAKLPPGRAGPGRGRAVPPPPPPARPPSAVRYMMFRRISVVITTTCPSGLSDASPVCSPHRAAPKRARASRSFWLDSALRGVV